MAMVRALARRYSTSTASYALGAIDRKLFLCNVRTGEFRNVNFPSCPVSQVLSTCKGLALVKLASPSLKIDNVNRPLVIGNPVTSKWKFLALAEPINGVNRVGLARNPVDHSVELIVTESYGRCDMYDFHSDRWIRGTDPPVRIQRYSNCAWHGGCFYGLFATLSRGDDEDEDEEDEDEYDAYKGSHTLDLYRCQVVAGVSQWTPIGLTGEEKRLLWLWKQRHLFVYQGRLLIYMWDPDITEPRKRQKMVELLEDGKVVEVPSWIDVADDLDPNGHIPLKEWCNIGYGGRSDDFFWLNLPLRENPQYIVLHSGLDGTWSEVTLPGGHLHSIVSFQGLDGDGDYDAFLDQPLLHQAHTVF